MFKKTEQSKVKYVM